MTDAFNRLGDAQDYAIQAAQRIKFLQEFLDHIAGEIEGMANMDFDAAEVSEYAERIRFIARLIEPEYRNIEKVADLVDTARMDLRVPLGIPPLPLAAD